MNKTQFWVLIGLSSVIVILLVTHIFLVRQATVYQNTMVQAQQIINQGQASKSIMEQLAVRIFKDADAKQDQELKELMKRQQITFTPTAANGADSSSAPAPGAATH